MVAAVAVFLSAAAVLLACAAMALPLNARHAPMTAVKIVFVVNNVMASASQKPWGNAMKVKRVRTFVQAFEAQRIGSKAELLSEPPSDNDRLIAAPRGLRSHAIPAARLSDRSCDLAKIGS